MNRTIIIATLVLAIACSRREQHKPDRKPTLDARRPASVSMKSQEPTAMPRAALPPLPNPPAGDRRDVTEAVGAALRAGIGDLDGDGLPELVVVDAHMVRVIDRSGHEIAREAVAGGIQAITVLDFDGDRRAEIVIGWGVTREHLQATARVTLHRLARKKLTAELVIASMTSRQEVAAILPAGASTLLVAYFDDKYLVKSQRMRRGTNGWVADAPVIVRMATSYAYGDIDADGRPDVVVGRVYGDDKDKDGDAFLLRSGGVRIPIPTTRGVRGLAIADVDGDGRNEIYLADGWHRNYGQEARGLLTWVHRADGGFRSELIEDTPGQYTIWRILPADVDGDGKPEIVTLGSHYVRVYQWRQGRWRGLTIAGESRDVAVGEIDGLPGDEILVVGERSEVISLRQSRWPD